MPTWLAGRRSVLVATIVATAEARAKANVDPNIPNGRKSARLRLRANMRSIASGVAVPRKAPACRQAQWVKGVCLHRARIAVAIDAGFDPRARTAMQPAKPREWTEEETDLLIELAQRKERVPAMARELGRHITSVRRRARE